MKARIKIPLPGFDTMALSLTLWLCSLPLVFLAVAPFFGLKVAALVAVIFLFLTFIMCWGICVPVVVRSYIREKQVLYERSLVRAIGRRIK